MHGQGCAGRTVSLLKSSFVTSFPYASRTMMGRSTWPSMTGELFFSSWSLDFNDCSSWSIRVSSSAPTPRCIRRGYPPYELQRPNALDIGSFGIIAIITHLLIQYSANLSASPRSGVLSPATPIHIVPPTSNKVMKRVESSLSRLERARAGVSGWKGGSPSARWSRGWVDIVADCERCGAAMVLGEDEGMCGRDVESEMMRDGPDGVQAKATGCDDAITACRVSPCRAL